MPRQRKLPKGLWKRGDAYYSRFRASGRLVRKYLSTNFDVAVELLNDLRSRADRADFGQVDNDCPWAELKAEFVRWARQSIRRPGDYEADLKRIESYTPLNSVRQISQALVMGYREWRLSQSIQSRRKAKPGQQPATSARKVSPRTVNREVGTLNNMLNKGVEWKRIGFNPLAGLEPLRHDTAVKQRRPLDLAEVRAIFETSPAHLLPVWRMFMCTGIRRNELVSLKFSDVDFDRQTVTIRAANAKSKRAREIPLDDTMLAMLVELRDAAAARQPVVGKTAGLTVAQAATFSRSHVFVSQANTPLANNLLTRFYAVCKRAGIDDAHLGGAVDIHSLRVSFATLALENGASPKAVQAILGHATLTMTMNVYAKATERAKREAIGSLPFAASSAPDHVLAVQKAHALSAQTKEGLQVVGA